MLTLYSAIAQSRENTTSMNMAKLLLTVITTVAACLLGYALHVPAALAAVVIPAALETIRKLYSVHDLMQWSGEAEATWRKRIQRGEIEIVKCGANTRVTENALRQWVARRTRPAKG